MNEFFKKIYLQGYINSYFAVNWLIVCTLFTAADGITYILGEPQHAALSAPSQWMRSQGQGKTGHTERSLVESIVTQVTTAWFVAEKGKPPEKGRRKASGLRVRTYDSRAA